VAERANLVSRHRECGTTNRIAADADVYEVCKGVGVTFDLTGLAERIQGHAADWQSLSLKWTQRGISPNYGNAATGASFEGAGWFGDISVWATGETELVTVRTSDGCVALSEGRARR